MKTMHQTLGFVLLAASATAHAADAASAPAANGLVMLGIHVTPECSPTYPQSALDAHAHGTTKLRFTVDAAGNVKKTEVIKGSGFFKENHQLDRAAAEALATCKFTPNMDAFGKPIDGEFEFSYNWKLKAEGDE